MKFSLLSRLQSLAPLFLLILGPLTLLYFLFLTHQHANKLEEQEKKINFLHQKFILAKLEKEKENAFLNKLKEASPYFIDQHLESLVFLKQEDHAVYSKITPRSLRFVEGKIRQTQELQEVEIRQEAPVIMNEADLKKTLALVEDVEIPPYQREKNSPQLLIQSIDLKKVPFSPHENFFEVNMQLIKREGVR